MSCVNKTKQKIAHIAYRVDMYIIKKFKTKEVTPFYLLALRWDVYNEIFPRIDYTDRLGV